MRLHRARHQLGHRPSAVTCPSQVTYHVPCHLQAQNIGPEEPGPHEAHRGRITLVQQCSGIDGTWGLRAENYDGPRGGPPLASDITGAGAEVVAGDCHLANGAIIQETGRVPLHPLQLMARAYGIPEDGRRTGSAAKLTLGDIATCGPTSASGSRSGPR